jgi:hypothetical protein
MFTAKQYRDKAAEYNRLTATAATSDEKREYQNGAALHHPCGQ